MEKYEDYCKREYLHIRNGDHARTDPDCENLWNWIYGEEKISPKDIWDHQQIKIDALVEVVKYYASEANWFKEWGHKDNWAISGNGDKARKILSQMSIPYN